MLYRPYNKIIIVITLITESLLSRGTLLTALYKKQIFVRQCEGAVEAQGSEGAARQKHRQERGRETERGSVVRRPSCGYSGRATGLQ